jgi:hypothetical protein
VRQEVTASDEDRRPVQVRADACIP